MKSREQFNHTKTDVIVCPLCFRGCNLLPQKRGFCGVNANVNGALTCLSYGRASVIHLDPIEKKPLYHVVPGMKIFSIGATGCNFSCPFCQNASLVNSPVKDVGKIFSIQQILDQAQEAGTQAVAFTYNEPTTSWLWYRDLARAAKLRNMLTVMVTNGAMTAVVRNEMAECIDAVNIDLKAGTAVQYSQNLGATRGAVIESIADLHDKGVWVELTTLLVPEMSDTAADLEKSAQEIYELVGPFVPWHLSAYAPAHKYTHRATPPERVLRRCEQLRNYGFHYVYAGNIAVEKNTYCPQCKTRLLHRRSSTVHSQLQDGACPKCYRPMEGIL